MTTDSKNWGGIPLGLHVHMVLAPCGCIIPLRPTTLGRKPLDSK